ncbi:hypothetical protein, partial [Klebsiella quasipneumoniae]|uniref:hypothetical protein n=1 Tax=Klebsiella quasipneumoniae TaxID=1463165 RepID=UPI00215390B0
PVTRSIFCAVRGESGFPGREGQRLSGGEPGGDQPLRRNLLENVNETHKYVLPLSTPRATLPIILGFAF